MLISSYKIWKASIQKVKDKFYTTSSIIEPIWLIIWTYKIRCFGAISMVLATKPYHLSWILKTHMVEEENQLLKTFVSYGNMYTPLSPHIHRQKNPKQTNKQKNQWLIIYRVWNGDNGLSNILVYSHINIFFLI